MKIVYRISYIIYSLFLICLLAVQAEAAQVVSLQELLENRREYEGKTIVYEGEAIGDIISDGENVWVNVRDETGAIGVFCPQELVEQIKHLGNYSFSGDIVSVRGIFHGSCSEHGGDVDIHAEKITVIQKGEEIGHPIEPWKVKLSMVLPAIVFILGIIYLIVRRFR